MKVKRALISVTDKTGLAPFAKGLRKLGVEIISTGGTLKLLRDSGIRARSIEEVTGFPEIFDGRLKTLHPKVHGGLLMVRSNSRQKKDARKYGIEPIDLVVVNLYKFQEAAGRKGVSEDEVVEHIDIGGPAMLRSAAKNFKYVAVVSRSDDYESVLKELQTQGGKLSLNTRRKLAAQVFELTQSYDEAIAGYFSRTQKNKRSSGAESKGKDLPDCVELRFQKVETLRYGENPHQRAAYYRAEGEKADKFKQLHGKELSFNNLLDIESAIELVDEFSEPAVAVIKHNNPSGAAEAKDLRTAAVDAIECDTLSAFGGIIAVNRILTIDAAQAIAERLAFFEVLIAPAFDAEALRLLKERKNLRLIEADFSSFHAGFSLRFGAAGLLLQDRDASLRGRESTLLKNLKWVTHTKPSGEDIKSLLFAWKCAKHVRSNAIVLAKGTKTVGVGAGQMSRIDSVRIAAEKAGEKARGSVMASDGFFPMTDNIEAAHRYGISMIIQPGGSIRDAEVIQASNDYGIGMVLTGTRHFRH